MGVRLLLISREGAARQAYIAKLDSISIKYDVVSNLMDVPEKLTELLYNGILLDVATSARATNLEKDMFRELLERFPFMRVKSCPESDSIKTLFFGSTNKKELSLVEFIEEHCYDFTPRQLTLGPRKHLILNVIISSSPDFEAGQIQKTTITELSPSDCFVFSTAEWVEGQSIWMKILELNDEDPIETVIEWLIGWGIPMQMPGLGLKFVHLTDSQGEQLNRWLHPNVIAS